MYNIKQITKLFILSLVLLVIGFSLAMEKSPKDLTEYIDKIELELESNITVIYSKVISGKLAKQINPKKYKNHVALEVLLAATQDHKIFIYDLESKEKIYELDLATTPLNQDISNTQITAVTIIKKEDAPIFMIYTKNCMNYTKDNWLLIQHNITTQQTSSESINSLRKHATKLATGFPKKYRYYANDSRLKSNIEHDTYSLELNFKDAYMDITYRNNKRKITYPNRIRLGIVKASPQQNSPFIAFRDRFPYVSTDTIYVYNVDTKKLVKRFERLKKIGIIIVDTLFGKEYETIIIKRKNKYLMYDLLDREYIFKQKTPEEQRYMSMITNYNEDTILLTYKNGIYFYYHPLSDKENDKITNKEDQKERKKFLKESYSNFKIKFIDKQNLDITKLLLADQ